MRDAGDHHIALPDHPLVSSNDSVAGRHVLKRWVGGVIVAGGIRFPVEVGQNQNGRDVGIDRLYEIVSLNLKPKSIGLRRNILRILKTSV